MAIVSRLSFVVAAVLAVGVRAESHLFKFQNNCGYGTPQLIQGTNVLSTGEDYTYNGIFSGIAYLQTGPCDFNAEHCTMLETTLVNPTVPGGGSSTDISLIDPHEFNVPMAFEYINGCDGQGKACLSADCKTTAFFTPTDYFAQVQCEEDNVGLLITFCPIGSGGSSSSSPSSSSKATTSEAHSTTSEAQSTTSNVIPTTTSVVPTETSKTVVTPPSSSVASTVGSSSSGIISTIIASTIIASTSVAPSSVASTTLSVASATSSSSVNRKQCKPGQKARRKRDVTMRDAEPKRDADAIKREALAHHRRGHGHH